MWYKALIKIKDVETLEQRVIEVESKEDLLQVVQNIRSEFNDQLMYVKFGLTTSPS